MMDFKTKTAAALLFLFWTVLAQDLDFDEDMKSRITARLMELGMEEGDVDIALPVHSRERWQSEECPGFFEDLVTFKLEFNDGLEPDSILMQQVETNDVSHETYGARMFGKEWMVGRSTVRPFLNCLSWDNEELVEAVRSKILPPSNLSYNFTVPLEELQATSLFGEVHLLYCYQRLPMVLIWQEG